MVYKANFFSEASRIATVVNDQDIMPEVKKDDKQDKKDDNPVNKDDKPLP